ncbi:hypothetical protein UPYG_G00151320 [Umbra pygmaea]|uniref:IRG-type G domain-containing protein n=1 Tax=Umbra pygmaea TaxID=75934 RepID=A0ABD0WX08_UMBPY
MTEKLSNKMVEFLLAPWQSSSPVTGLEGRLLAALELYDHFNLDVAVTGGTQEANTRLAKALCGLRDDKEEEEKEEPVDEEASDRDVYHKTKAELEGGLENIQGDNTIQDRTEVSERKEIVDEIVEDDTGNKSHTDNKPMLLHPQFPSIRIWTVPSIASNKHPILHYDVFVVLTSEHRKEDLPSSVMELRDREQPMVLVRAEQELDLVKDRITGPCKTCAWERRRDRLMEIERKRLAAGARVSLVPEDVKQTLLELRDIGETFTTSLPELRKEAFCQFMAEVVKEKRIPNLMRNAKESLLSAGLRVGKVRQQDVDSHGDLFQSMDLTNPPDRLLSALRALDHLRLDLGVLGPTGCGSSSLVNSLLGLKNRDEGASPTGVTETTTHAVGFPHPELPNTWLWDLPGMGRIGDLPPTNTTPKNKSPSQPLTPSPSSFLFDHPCDVYILVSPLRLSLYCIQMLQTLSAQGRPCYVVLSKLDQIDEGAVGEVRRWSEEALGQIGLNTTPFLLSTLQVGDLDFPKLQEVLHGALASHRRSAFARYVVELLKSQVWEENNLADRCKHQ